ncbi:ABC transporter permease [Microvirga rosea]|uniref:ABC transporter permease n=1 Tax=Microvirga rosea TaxID=2715425 RepID=UPI001D0A4974|nr:ABC transporter permease [Microvirga rosea]MCB8821931.1 ABC transporter permease [Microvirga rosea]
MNALAIAVDNAPWQRRWRRFRRNRTALSGLYVLVALIVFSLAAAPLEALLGIDANNADLLSRFDGRSATNWLGHDELGRDVLIRLMYGGQVSLGVGIAATLLGAVIGISIGLAAGYFGGNLDALLMRFTDGIIALPLLPLLIVLAAIDLTKLGFSADFARSSAASFYRIVLIIALIDWTRIARLVRASTLSIREREFVLAARVSGAGTVRILLRSVLPNVIAPIIVACSQVLGSVILFEAVLSFLGFGIAPPTPSWGNMLNNAQELVATAPMLAIYPGLLIFITVIAVNFIGDGLQDAFDPRAE